MSVKIWFSLIVLCCSMSGYFAQMDDRIHFDHSSDSLDVDTSTKKSVKKDGDEGFCIYEEKKFKMVTVSVPYSETEKYYGRCRGYYFKKCLNERQVIKTRDEKRIQEYVDTVRRCCEGYAESPDKRCLPICEHSCVFGNCTLPNTCTCYDGYKTNEQKPNVCEPACVGCTHGSCLYPNVCQCNPGYNWDSESVECVPVCGGECLNGKCVAPELCSCDEGFIHHPSHSICIPHCEEPCEHGVCIGTNQCECDFGYHFSTGSHSVCEPRCELSCKNAKCTAPNDHDGYTILDDNKPHECHCGQYCVEIDGKCHCLDEGQRVNGDRIRNNISSICSESNCQNGVCLTPFDCECYDGFEKNDINMCVSVNETCIDDPSNCNGADQPTCNCINGICSANQTCVCVNGFRMSEGHNDLCIPSCSKECVNGFCINPESCECDTGYRLGYNESQSHICHPICDSEAEDNNGCINGTCVAPDTCACFDGFTLDLNANYTCIPIPFDAQAQKSGIHWAWTGFICLLVFVISLAAAAFYIHQRRCEQYNVPKRDEANEPITAYLSEEM